MTLTTLEPSEYGALVPLDVFEALAAAGRLDGSGCYATLDLAEFDTAAPVHLAAGERFAPPLFSTHVLWFNRQGNL